MKIDTSAKSPASSGVKESTARGSKQGASAIDTASTAKKSASQDSVQITSLSTQLQAMENVPVIDHARVEAIKLAISEGKFSVNAGAIADSLLASVKDLVQNQKA